jgi:DNA-binding CsgD family transcriptional regulator
MTQYSGIQQWTYMKTGEWLGDTIINLTFYLLLLFMILKSRIQPDPVKQNGIRNFALIYFLSYFILDLESSHFLAQTFGYPRTTIMIILVFTAHIPPLLYMKKFLKSYVRGIRFSTDDQPQLNTLFGQKGITKRETEIIGLLLGSKSRREIQKDLNISIKTVENHISNIYKKMAVTNRVNLIKQISQNLQGHS